MSRPQFLAPYSANHNRVRKVRGSARARLCDGCCGKAGFDWALIHGRTGVDPEDYVALCRSCHWHYDGDTQRLGPVHRSQAHPEGWLPNKNRDVRGRFARG